MTPRAARAARAAAPAIRAARAARVAAPGLVAALLVGCAALGEPPQSAALARTAPAGLPVRAELRTVPFFPQTPYHCGPAALATVLVHAGFATSPEALADAVFLPAREGALQVEMLAAARRAGAMAVPLPGTLEVLLAEVAAGTPVVVLLNLALPVAPRWHYAVAVGYDLEARELILRSGTTERERIGFAVFERTWARGGHWAFAALPPGRLPRGAREADAAQAALGVERISQPAAALAAYASVLERWPDNATAGIGQGNVRAALGDWSGAAKSFERVAARQGGAAVWHNLAYARWRAGQGEAARAALAEARAAAEREPHWRERIEALAHEIR